jgi:hypothetical protein
MPKSIRKSGIFKSRTFKGKTKKTPMKALHKGKENGKRIN